MRLRTFFLVIVLTTIVIQPAQANESDRVFIPVLVSGLTGAGGSVWQTDLWATNISDQPVLYQIVVCLQSAGCNTINTIPAQHSQQRGDDRPGGRWLPTDPSVQLKARLRDVSRNAFSAGVELPLIHESEFRSDEIDLSAIPRDSRFRITLRIYGLDAGGNLTIDQMDSDGNVLLTTPVSLPSPGVPGLLAGYAQISLDALPAGASPIRMRIRPRSSNLRIWAFASITNNATSEVTLVLPYRQ